MNKLKLYTYKALLFVFNPVTIGLSFLSAAVATTFFISECSNPYYIFFTTPLLIGLVVAISNVYTDWHVDTENDINCSLAELRYESQRFKRTTI